MADNASKSPIDILYRDVASFRDTREFKKLLNFCARLKTLSPYNAALVRMQRPTARMLLSSDDWRRRFNRRPKANAKPAMILVPFGPVQYVFDIVSTELIPGIAPINEEELHTLSHSAKPDAVIDQQTMDTLIFNLAQYGIDASFRIDEGAQNSAEITRKDVVNTIEIEYDRVRYTLEACQYYKLDVISADDKNALLGVICRELAQLFCHHLDSPDGRWWHRRDITPAEAEFEMHAVAWLVCRRHNVNDRVSDEYIVRYCKQEKEIPAVSIDAILHAVSDIEKMLSPVPCKDSLLYRRSPAFKTSLDTLLKEVKGGNLPHLFTEQEEI